LAAEQQLRAGVAGSDVGALAVIFSGIGHRFADRSVIA
jgi:hypothetical protein